MLEAAIERKFVKAVRAAGGWAIKLTSIGMAGLPDRLVLFPQGKCSFVELKAPGKKMRPLQIKRAKELRGLGFSVYCIDRTEQILPTIKEITA